MDLTILLARLFFYKDFHLQETKKTNSASGENSHTSELLDELNSMNQILRERGEKISRLENLVREKNKELENLKEVQSQVIGKSFY